MPSHRPDGHKSRPPGRREPLRFSGSVWQSSATQKRWEAPKDAPKRPEACMKRGRSRRRCQTVG
eukprot:2729836-Alexandrium_andersonii.AAC.1